MQAIGRTRKIGGSLVVTIPKKIVKEKSIQEGELVKFDVDKARLDGFGKFKGIGKFTRKDREEMWRDRLK